MRSVRTFAAVAALASLAIASDVHDLTGETFNDFIKSNDLVLAEFFAPWCGHCKALAPEYEEAATTLKPKNIPLVKVDCTVEADLCKEYDVEGYPTVKVFRGPDNIKPYSGARKAPAIISYMTKQQLPAISVLTADTHEEFKTTDKVVLISYIASDDKTNNQTYTALAEKLRDEYIFGATNDAALAAAAGVKQPAIVLYKSFDEGKDTFEEAFTEETIVSFIKSASTPLVGEVGPETYAGYMDSGIPLAYIFAETAEEREQYAKEFKSIAQQYKGKINFATIDAKAFGAHAGNLNLPTEKFPSFAIQETAKEEKYPFEGHDLSEKKIAAFVKDFADGKLAPSVKSEPVPEKNDGPVTILVATQYKELVIDNDKDVLVEFYAPWCGHCKALAPTYDKLGELYMTPEYSSKVAIAKVDATANDIPEKIQGFPTIKLYKAGEKDTPIDYNGSRSLEDLAKFIKDNGKHGVDGLLNKPADAAPAADGPVETDGGAKAAAAATDVVKSVVSDAAEAVKTFVADNGEVDSDHHDEL